MAVAVAVRATSRLSTAASVAKKADVVLSAACRTQADSQLSQHVEHASRRTAVAVTEDATKHNVQHVDLLLIDGAFPQEVVGEHRAVNQIGKHATDAFDGDVPNPA